MCLKVKKRKEKSGKKETMSKEEMKRHEFDCCKVSEHGVNKFGCVAQIFGGGIFWASHL